MSDLTLRLAPLAIDAQPEGRYADDKRTDIRVCFASSHNNFNVPIEIKKSTHRGLWTAIHDQLIPKYSRDPGAGGTESIWCSGTDLIGVRHHLPAGGQDIPGGYRSPCVTRLQQNRDRRSRFVWWTCPDDNRTHNSARQKRRSALLRHRNGSRIYCRAENRRRKWPTKRSSSRTGTS